MGKKKSGAGAAKDDLPPAQGKGRRRNKEIDDDEYDIGIVEEPVASANGGDAESKMKNSNDEEVDDESSQIQFGGKKKRGKKGKNAKQTEDDDDFDVAKDEDEAEDAEIAFVGKKKSKGKKGKKEDQASGFSLLSQIDGDAQAEEGEVDNDADDLDLDEMVFAGKKKSKEKKGKKAAPPSSVSAFSALGDIDNAGEVDDDDIDSVEPEEVAFTGKKKSKGKKGAKDAERGSSAFATLADIDGHGDTDEGEVNEDIDSMEPEEMVFTGKKKSKEKKGKKDPEEKVSSSTFAALAATESHEEPIEGKVNDDIHSIESEEMIFTGKKKPKGKKGKKDAEEHVSSSTFSALAETEIQEEPVVGKVNDDIDSAEPEEMVFTGKKKSKAKKGKKDLEQDSSSAYSALAEIGTDKDGSLETTSAQPDEDEMDVDGIMFTGKKKKGKKEKRQDDDVSIESTVETVVSAYVQPDQQVSAKSSCSLAIDQEITERALESVAQSKNKKKKNKKGARTAEEEENMDKLLAGLGEGPGQATTSADSKQTDEAGALPKQTEEPSALSVEEPNATDPTIADDSNAPGESAAAKKKKKKKEKEKEKKAAAAVAAEEKAAAAAAEKKDDKKIPKHVREMQERLARVKEAEEKKKREGEEKRRKEEEERLRLEELERQKEEAKRRKKEREKEKLLKKKQEGKLLTGKKKEEARRLAIMREQFLAQSGVIGDLKKEDNGVPKKPRYDTRKKKHLSPAAATEPVVSENLQVVNEYQQQPSTPVTYETPEPPEEKVVEMEEYSNEAEDEVQTQPDKESEEEEEEEEDDWDAKSWDDKDVKLRVRSAFAEEEEEEQVTKKTSKPAVVSFKAALVKGTNGALPTSTHVPANTVAPKSAVSTQENMFVKPPSIKKDSVSSTKKAENMEESTDEESDDEEEAEGNKQKGAASKREARKAEALSKRSSEDLRSPICCILGHVDTGKTKLLDCIRRTNVQEGEAGGITQQIGATYFPMENIRERTKELKADANLRVPGLLVIDTPGHESFTNLRSRGSSLCDIAILVVDIMHGLEPQTIESLNLLKMRHTPFVVALNKVDRLYGWKPRANAPIRATLKQQSKDVQNEFEQRLSKVITELKEQGLNSELYYKNKEIRKYVSIVPTSAVSGEGVPDLLLLLIQLTQKMMEERLMYISEVQCTVLEVKVIEGLGTTIDVILINGVLHEGDQIVVCGMQGPIVTNIRALLTPHPMKELRVKGSYQHHKELKAAQGIKITAQGLEHAIAGTQLYLVGPDDDVEDIKYEAMEDMRNVMSRIDKSGEGVYVQASTLGSLEALLEFLKTPEVNIPVSGIGIGPVHKKDVMRASVMLEKKKEYATILAFDVKVTPEARELADEAGVRIFMADIIYHLFDQFKAYVTDLKEEKKKEAAEEAVFPCVLKIIPKCVFNKKDPIIVGVDILEGAARVGTPLCVPSREFIAVGRISSIEINHKAVDVAKKGQQVAMKIAGSNPEENQKMVGRHFDVEDELVSHISRKSIDILKENYREDVSKEEWTLIRRLKVIFKIP